MASDIALCEDDGFDGWRQKATVPTSMKQRWVVRAILIASAVLALCCGYAILVNSTGGTAIQIPFEPSRLPKPINIYRTVEGWPIPVASGWALDDPVLRIQLERDVVSIDTQGQRQDELSSRFGVATHADWLAAVLRTYRGPFRFSNNQFRLKRRLTDGKEVKIVSLKTRDHDILTIIDEQRFVVLSRIWHRESGLSNTAWGATSSWESHLNLLVELLRSKEESLRERN